MKTLKVSMVVLGMVLGTTVMAQRNENRLLELKDELALTSTQIAEIKKINADFDLKRERTKKNPDISEEKRREVLIEQRRESRRKIDEVLTTEQKRRMGEILKDRYPERTTSRVPRQPKPEGSRVPDKREGDFGKRDERDGCCCKTHGYKKPHPVFDEHPGKGHAKGHSKGKGTQKGRCK